MGKLTPTWGGRFWVETPTPTLKQRLHQLFPLNGLCRAEIDNRMFPNAVKHDGAIHGRCCLSDKHGHESEMGEGHYYPSIGVWFNDSRYLGSPDKEKFQNAKGTP